MAHPVSPRAHLVTTPHAEVDPFDAPFSGVAHPPAPGVADFEWDSPTDEWSTSATHATKPDLELLGQQLNSGALTPEAYTIAVGQDPSLRIIAEDEKGQWHWKELVPEDESSAASTSSSSHSLLSTVSSLGLKMPPALVVPEFIATHPIAQRSAPLPTFDPRVRGEQIATEIKANPKDASFLLNDELRKLKRGTGEELSQQLRAISLATSELSNSKDKKIAKAATEFNQTNSLLFTHAANVRYLEDRLLAVEHQILDLAKPDSNAKKRDFEALAEQRRALLDTKAQILLLRSDISQGEREAMSPKQALKNPDLARKVEGDLFGPRASVDLLSSQVASLKPGDILELKAALLEKRMEVGKIRKASERQPIERQLNTLDRLLSMNPEQRDDAIITARNNLIRVAKNGNMDAIKSSRRDLDEMVQLRDLLATLIQ